MMNEEQIKQIHKIILDTRELVKEAALTGFNYHDGNWAEKLFANQQYLTEALRIIEGKRL